MLQVCPKKGAVLLLNLQRESDGGSSFFVFFCSFLEETCFLRYFGIKEQLKYKMKLSFCILIGWSVCYFYFVSILPKYLRIKVDDGDRTSTAVLCCRNTQICDNSILKGTKFTF